MLNRLIKGLALFLPLAGLACLFLYAMTAGSWMFVVQVFTNFFFIGGAAFIVGGLTGFIFGVPRIASGRKDVSNERYTPNTNLEQISDWLTKILVGIGLVQIDDIMSALIGFSTRAADQITAVADETNVIASLIVYFGLSGFLDGYLATRLLLPRALLDAEAAHARAEVNAQVEREKQAEK